MATFSLNREQFLAFLAVMSYNKQFDTEWDPWQFSVSSLTINQNSDVAYEVYGRRDAEQIELRLRMYCNFSDINRCEPFLFVETREDHDGTRVNIFSAYTLLDESFLAYENNTIRQQPSLIINDPSLLPYFIEEEVPNFIRLEDGAYLMDETYSASTV